MDTYRLIQVERQDDVCCVRLQKTRLDEGELLQLGDELLGLTNASRRGRIVLVLGPQPPDCLYSVFLAKLVSVRNAARRQGGELVLCRLGPLAYSVFEACQLHREFVFRPDTPEAMDYFASPAVG